LQRKIADSKRRASAKTLGARVGRVLERSKMGKFARWDVRDGRLSWNFDQDKIVTRNSSMAVTLLVVRCPKRRWLRAK
jgi:hypothetical protein